MASDDSTPGMEGRSASEKNRAGLWFLVAVIAVYIVLFFFKAAFIEASLRHFLSLIESIAPILVLIFVILWLLNLSRGMQDRLIQLADKRSGFKGWAIALGAGILSHGPVYAWYPLLENLQARGARPALIATFLYARSIKIPYLPLMVHYFGIRYTLLLTGFVAVFSLLQGWLVELSLKPARKV